MGWKHPIYIIRMINTPALSSDLASNYQQFPNNAVRYGMLYLALLGAQKSGASKVLITYDDHAGLIQIEDDGHLEISEQEADLLFGQISQGLKAIDRWSPQLFRLAGALIASDIVKVITGPTTIQLERDAFLREGSKVLDDNGSRNAGTVVIYTLKKEMHWSTSEVRRTLQKLVEGFSPKVMFNGAALHSPKALDESFHQFGIGRFDLKSVVGSEGEKPAFFLHGLPIQLESDTDFPLPGGMAVHLDENMIPFNETTAFDRVSVPAAQSAFIVSELEAVWSSYLESKRFLLSPVDFSWKFSQACLSTGQSRFINDLPLHPAMWGCYSRLPGSELFNSFEVFVHGEGLLSKRRQALIDLNITACTCHSLAPSYLQALAWPTLKSELDPEHWAYKSAIDINAVDFVITAGPASGTQVIQTGLMKGMTVVFCSSYELYPLDDRLPQVVVTGVPAFCAKSQLIFITPESHRDLQTLVWQISVRQGHDHDISSSDIAEGTKLLLNLACSYPENALKC